MSCVDLVEVNIVVLFVYSDDKKSKGASEIG